MISAQQRTNANININKMKLLINDIISLIDTYETFEKIKIESTYSGGSTSSGSSTSGSSSGDDSGTSGGSVATTMKYKEAFKEKIENLLNLLKETNDKFRSQDIVNNI